MRYFELFEDKSPKAREIILQKYGEQMTQKISSDPHYSKMSINDLLDFIIQNDPTSKSIYTDWILKMYLNGSIRYIEDISKTFEPLSFYEKLKNKLPVDQRDINKFKSFREFDDFIDQHKGTDIRSNNEQEKEYENQLIKSGQAEIFYNSPDIKIIIPKTKEASIYFGKNTKWCTAAKNDNMFDYYNKSGDLYIILFKKENKRWQFHFPLTQFMDEKDEKLSNEEVKSVLPLFGFTDEEFVSMNGNFIIYIDNPSETVQLAAIKEDPDVIRLISNPSEKLQLAAVQQNGYTIKYIKNPSETVQLAAAKRVGDSLKFINNPSEAVQIAAINQYAFAIQYVKNPSKKVQMIAVKKNPRAVWHIKPQTTFIKKYALKQDPDSIASMSNISDVIDYYYELLIPNDPHIISEYNINSDTPLPVYLAKLAIEHDPSVIQLFDEIYDNNIPEELKNIINKLN